MQAVRDLEDEPFPRGSERLTGIVPPVWRLRVGDYRVFYSVQRDESLVVIEAIARRTTQTYERLR